jgi:hypothetical protein
MRNGVCLYQVGSEFDEHLSDGRLAACDPAGEAEF